MYRQRVTCESRPQSNLSPAQQQRPLPTAPPTRMPPPPPPPPSPPEQLNINISRRALFAAMLGGTALWYYALKAGVPLAAVDRQRGVALLRTKGGNIVAAAQDEAGRVFLFDRAGNIYYDTGDRRLGVFIVDTAGEMYNEYVEPRTDEVKRVAVGNLLDLTSVKVSEVGGVPLAELRRSVSGFRGGRVVGFPKLPDGDGLTWENLMPPNAPATVSGDGSVRPPPMLEDYEVDLEGKGGRFPEGYDDASILRSLRREK
jgi:hypothetical protein